MAIENAKNIEEIIAAAHDCIAAGEPLPDHVLARRAEIFAFFRRVVADMPAIEAAFRSEFDDPARTPEERQVLSEWLRKRTAAAGDLVDVARALTAKVIPLSRGRR